MDYSQRNTDSSYFTSCFSYRGQRASARNKNLHLSCCRLLVRRIYCPRFTSLFTKTHSQFPRIAGESCRQVPPLMRHRVSRTPNPQWILSNVTKHLCFWVHLHVATKHWSHVLLRTCCRRLPCSSILYKSAKHVQSCYK